MTADKLDSIQEQRARLSQSVDHNGLAIGIAVENWAPRNPPPSAEMKGQYCALKPFDPEQHCAELFSAFALDEEGRNWTYLPYGPFQSEAHFYQWCDTQCREKDPLFHTIIDTATGAAVGMASYLRIAPAAGSIEVGHIHFSPRMQGTRVATEAMYLMMRRVFDELGYRRYEWKCDALNAPSCRAAERFGFSFEGIFRQATVYKGRNRDTAWFALLDKDWPRVRHGFENWLGNNNFNGDGQQLKSLRACIGS